MTRPHEETWTATADEQGPLVLAGDGTARAEPRNEEDAKLIAAAPALARLVLSFDECPVCMLKPGDEDSEHGHASNCRVLVVMRAAGIRP